ncbi:MAG: hypothetical protein ACKOF7_13705, partial [Phycisphaerales bacterium]
MVAACRTQRSSDGVAATERSGASLRRRCGDGSQRARTGRPATSRSPSPTDGSSTIAKSCPVDSGRGSAGRSQAIAASTCSGLRVQKRAPSSGRAPTHTTGAWLRSAPTTTDTRAGTAASSFRSSGTAATPPGTQVNVSTLGATQG